MASMEALARLMRELEDQLVVCMRCGMCQSVCPVFDQTGREADVARGKLALLSGLMESMFDDPEGVYQRLNKCLLCGSCAANCPSGVSVQEIFLKARAIPDRLYGPAAGQAADPEGHAGQPEAFRSTDRVGGPISENFHPSGQRHRRNLLCPGDVAPDPGSPFPDPGPGALSPSGAVLDRPAGRSGLKVAIFTGCLIDKMFPAIAHSTIKVLDHFGVGIYPAGQPGLLRYPGACPAVICPPFQKLLAHNLERFEAGEFDCAGHRLRHLYLHHPRGVAEDGGRRHREAAARLARRTMDINQFLIRDAGLNRWPVQPTPSGRHLPRPVPFEKKPEGVQRTACRDQCHSRMHPDGDGRARLVLRHGWKLQPAVLRHLQRHRA
jgi:glycolate oxidase iron-sulfur subunit